MNDSTLDLARANLYRYLSLALLPPSDERFAALYDPDFRAVTTAAVDWLRTDSSFHPQALGPGELHPAQFEATRLFPNEEHICEAYLEVFGHTISKECPPYEGEYYANSDITFRSQKLADVAGFYRAFGLDRRAKARERIDFLSFEAEFMEIVIARQLYATGEGLGAESVDVCMQSQRRFFIEHLGWWLPAFGVQLEARTHSDYYRTLAGFVCAFAAAERAVLSIAPFTELPSPHLDAPQPEGACFSCGPAGEGGCQAPTESVFRAVDQ